jgi:predicted nucleotidyltransferase
MKPQPIHASIFGSFARHEAGPTSDIDLLLILPEGVEIDDQWFGEMRVLGKKVVAWTGNRLEYLVFTEGELRDLVSRSEAIVDSWLADSVVVIGAPLDSIVSSMKSVGRNIRR